MAAEPQPAFGVACGTQQTPPEPHAPSGIDEPPHDSFALIILELTSSLFDH